MGRCNSKADARQEAARLERAVGFDNNWDGRALVSQRIGS
jgi:hypothetical protein